MYYLFHGLQCTEMASAPVTFCKCKIKAIVPCIWHAMCLRWWDWLLGSASQNLLKWEKSALRCTRHKQCVCSLLILSNNVHLLSTTFCKCGTTTWENVASNLIEADNEFRRHTMPLDNINEAEKTFLTFFICVGRKLCCCARAFSGWPIQHTAEEWPDKFLCIA